MNSFGFFLLFLVVALTTSHAAKPDLDEYSGDRSDRQLQTAFASKGFTWLSGSPADNEKLSIGKNAQFFGFVALRYQSGRAANRGDLGRAVYALATDEQRKFFADAVVAEAECLKNWWSTRGEILRILEAHLYTGEPVDLEKLKVLGEEFGRLGVQVALHEARAFAAFEDSATDEQKQTLAMWRADPEKAGHGRSNGVRVTASGFDHEQSKQLEDLFAKGFSWLTGTAEDNEIIPLGQPAQFFGFVSIRQKSGHGANRGQIAKSFQKILTKDQLKIIDNAVQLQRPVVGRFLQERHEVLDQLASLRHQPDAFDAVSAQQLGAALGRSEIEAGIIEAQAYRKIRASMTDEQLAAMMKLRGNYILDESQVESMTHEQRGETLAILCAGCHGSIGQEKAGMVAPPLANLFSRPIATADSYQYSEAFQKIGHGKEKWTSELLDEFLTDPKKFAPGTKMEFQGILRAEDRQALIDYLRSKP